MASVIVIVITAGCGAYQYFKGALVKSFATLMAALLAAVIAYSYFEPLSGLLISRKMLVLWAQPVCFLLLFVVCFAVLQTVASVLTKTKVDFGAAADRAGRVVLGLVTGLLIAGVVLTALAAAPLSNTLPYQRFASEPSGPDDAKKVLLNADGFATGWFSLISRGGLGGKRSFATIHADFLDQLYLNRHRIRQDVPIITDPGAIKVPPKAAAWAAPEDLVDADGNPVQTRSGEELVMIRVGLSTKMLPPGGNFTLAQLRAICAERAARNRLAGKGVTVYPAGYLRTANQLQTRKLTEPIKIQKADIMGTSRWVDFAFYMPQGYEPVAVAFKANAIAEVPGMAGADERPKPEPFVPVSACTSQSGKLKPITSAKIHGLEVASDIRFLADFVLSVQDQNDWQGMQGMQGSQSTLPARFEDGKIVCVQAELKVPEPAEEAEESDESPSRGRFDTMLKISEGYRLVSVKCNSPAAGRSISGNELPVLVEITGTIHRAIGIAASGQVADGTIYEIDYCTEQVQTAEDGTVSRAWPERVWLGERAEKITQFYVIYMVKAGEKRIIGSVKPAGADTGAPFEEYEGFLVQ